MKLRITISHVLEIDTKDFPTLVDVAELNKFVECLRVGMVELPEPYHTTAKVEYIGPPMRVVENHYFKDFGDGRTYISGLPIPRDADGITRNINFTRCDFHPGSVSDFENCQIDGKPIPDGRGCLYDYECKLLGTEL